MKGRGGFRRRITITIIGLVGVTAILVSIVAYLLIRGSLREQLVSEGVAVARFGVEVLVPAAGRGDESDRTAFEASGLAGRFASRGATDLFVDFGDGDPYVSRPELLATNSLVSPRFADLVGQGRFAYEFVDVAGDNHLVVGARVPSSAVTYYFFTDAGSVGRTISDLWRFLLVALGAVLTVGALAARVVADSVLRPVGSANAAAQQLAAGRLDVRVPVRSNDEFGNLSQAFNVMAESLEHQIMALAASEARERRFVGDVAHELRTPLTGLSGAAQLLESNLGSMEGSGRRAAELLVGDVGRLVRLVEELLEISRLDVATDSASLAEVDVRRFLAAVVDAKAPHAEVIVHGSQVAFLDRVGLERIVSNLVDNAVAHAPDARLTLSADVRQELLTVTVSDDGPGIAAEHLPYIFDRFYKADDARQGGSGLGLAIARRHARRMRGDLVAVPQDRGVRFELRVPVTGSLPPGDPMETSHPDDGPTSAQEA